MLLLHQNRVLPGEEELPQQTRDRSTLLAQGVSQRLIVGRLLRRIPPRASLSTSSVMVVGTDFSRRLEMNRNGAER